jgi:hypothetical protein
MHNKFETNAGVNHIFHPIQKGGKRSSQNEQEKRKANKKPAMQDIISLSPILKKSLSSPCANKKFILGTCSIRKIVLYLIHKALNRRKIQDATFQIWSLHAQRGASKS